MSILGLGRHPLEPSGVPPAHSVAQGCIVLENWVSKGGLGAPLGPSSGSLCVHLWPLWQHMVAMLVFRGPRGGIWRPNVLKVTSGHVALCAITIAKTDVFTESHFFSQCTPKSPPRAPKSHLWVPFLRHLGSRCRLVGELRTICGTPGGPLWI
jgi:hypothetical protein